jgi:hypothetical protein
MAQALDQPEQRSGLAAAGQSMVLREFTLDRMVTNIETWLDGILAASHRPTGRPCIQRLDTSAGLRKT